MTIQTLASTTNFNIQYEDGFPNAKKRASAISAVCETEFAVLTRWFRIPGSFGTSDRITVIIDLPHGGGGNNQGYQIGGLSTMHVDTQDNNNNDLNAAEMVKMIFVNELVEIFMGYLSQHGLQRWQAGNSSGEGLSQLCGILRFPTGHYLYYASWVNQWLSSGRIDYVNSPEATDQNPISFGCALLFLSYLSSQLGFRIDDIIAAGDRTLDAVYRNLTGVWSPNPFPHFKQLVDSYFPGTSTITGGNLDNPFPLKEILSNPGDILWHNNSTNETQIWVWDGHRVTRRLTVLDERGSPFLVGLPFSIVGTGHFSQNGNPDILWHNKDTNETQIWFMNRERVRRRATVLDELGRPFLVGLPFSIVGIGGPNGDGKSEIVWHNKDTNETQIWFMDGERVNRRATVLDEQGSPIFVGLPFSIVGVADLSGDGNPDILWHNKDTNETQIWFMDRERVRRRATVVDEQGNPIFVGLPFSIVGARDLTPGLVLPSDQPQILWYNKDTGETQIWFMNGERVSGRATVLDEQGNPFLVGPPFSIVGASHFGIGVIS